MRTIKKYQNRKLYDTQEKQYINLTQIARLAKEGEEIKVIDNGNGQDITASTLTQVLIGSDDANLFFPTKVLRGLLSRRHQLEPYGDFKSRFLEDPARAINDEIQYRMETLITDGLISEETGSEILEMLQEFPGKKISDHLIEEEIIQRVANTLETTRDEFGTLLNQLNYLEDILANMN